MGIVFGYLSLICFCMLVAKWIARRCNLIKFDKVLMRIHRPVSLLLIVFCILHISFVIPVLRNRNVLVNVSGVLAVVFMIVLIFSCHVLKQKDRRMKWHRILTILMVVCIVWHVVVYFKDFREYQRNVESIVFENIEFKDQEFIYDGKYHSIVVEGDIPEGTVITYKTNNIKTNSFKEIGEYQIEATLECEFYISITLTATLKIIELPIYSIDSNK